MALDGGHLQATTRGEIFSLDPGTGMVRWQNPRIAVLREKQRRDEEAPQRTAG